MDAVFKALADQTRRQILDTLRATDGLTLAELCVQSEMSRQAVSKHLAILEHANLVVCIRDGRYKKHFLNPVPIQQIMHRWVNEYSASRADALIQLKSQIESKEE